MPLPTKSLSAWLSRPTAGPNNRVALKLEDLEDRATPAASAFTVNGLAQWTDSANKLHQIPGAVVEIYDRDAGGVNNKIGTTTTNNAGKFSFSGAYDDGANGTPDVFVRVLARSPAVDVKPTGAGASTYFLQSGVLDNVAAGATVQRSVTAGNASDNDTAFSVFHALQVISAYTGNLTGKIPSLIDVRYDNTIAGSFFRTTPSNQLFIRGTAKFEWDVIHHEYGHYVQGLGGFQNNPGGAHGFGDNLAATRGNKDIGVRLAWGEGWPSYFGISGQAQMGTAALAIPQVGDTSYQAWGGGININLETNPGVGEDNEVSVWATLWDLYDGAADGNDFVQMSDLSLYKTFKDSAAKTIGQAWEALAAAQDTAGKTRLGAVFAQNKIAPDWAATNPADNAAATAAPMTFRWVKNGGGTPNPLNDFRIKFYSSDFSRVIFQKDLGDVDNYTPSAADWATIIGGDAVIKYVVEGRNKASGANHPATPGGALGYYWSGARTLGGVKIAFVIDDTGSMGEEIASVREALQKYIDTVESKLKPGEKPPTIQLVTFKDNVTVRITSNDLAAVRAQVAALFASGGGDCPEFSQQALAQAVENVAPGGTILMATDASTQPGVDASALLAKMRAKRIKLNTILSGDCGPIGSSPGGGGPGASAGATAAERHAEGDAPPDGDCHCNTGGAGTVGTAVRLNEPSPDGSDFDPEDGSASFDDPGQPPIDDHGDATEDATLLIANSDYVFGAIRGDDPADVFSFELKGGTRYVVQVRTADGASLQGEVLGPDGTTNLATFFAPNNFFSDVTEQEFTTGDAGTYFLKLTGTGGDANIYEVRVTDDPLAGLTSAVDLYSALSAGTGGAFFVRDEVNSGDPGGYVAALFNVMASTLGATVLGANPGSAPQGQTVAVTLAGAGTNWRAGQSQVTFSDPGLVVKSVTVTSPTTLTVLVEIGAGVATGFYDVAVTTPLGGGTETAGGFNVFRVTDATSEPTLLSADPANVTRGTTATVTIRGANVNWNDTTAVALGEGTKVTAVRVLAPNRLEADVTIDPLADVAFRTATVTTGDQVLTLQRAIFVGTGGLAIPHVTNLSVTSGRPGQTLDVTVTGTNTSFEDGVTTATFGDGITVTNVDVTSPTSAVVTIRIEPGATAGFRDVQLITGGEIATALGAFFVDSETAAGNVTATVVKGKLRLTGSAAAEQLSIVAGKRGVLFLVGQGGTTINGRTSIALTAKKGIEIIDLGGGNNVLSISGLKQSGRVTFLFGDGDDTLRLFKTKFSASKNVFDFGAGTNTLELVKSSLGRRAIVRGLR